MCADAVRPPDRTATLAGGTGLDGVVPPQLPPRWRPLRVLGLGGQAAVWLADDVELGEQVALKVFAADLPGAARERLRQEVRLGHSLSHPNLVRFFELVEAENRLAVVMEWMPGGSLGERLEAGPLPVEAVVTAAAEVLAALSYLHAQGIVHRDVKPSNLLVDGTGRVRLGDLGLVRLVDRDANLTRSTMTVGTPAFMSPEQIRGETATPASDLYSLGATMYQLITGRQPFEAASEFEVANLHLKALLPDPRRLRPDCPRWLARFIKRLMEKRPSDRFSDASAALDALQHHRLPLGPRMRRRTATVVASLAVGALAVWGLLAIRARMARTATVRVEAAGSALEGFDAGGLETWRLALDSPVRQAEQADLDGDGSSETVAVTYRVDEERAASFKRSEVVVVGLDGTVWSRVHPESMAANWDFPYPLDFRPVAELRDLDGDGHPEVVLRCMQTDFYPTMLLVFWPRTGAWQPLLFHSGFITDAEPVPGASSLRLRFCGVNNRLSMLPVVGEVMIGQSPPRAGTLSPALGSPETGISPSSTPAWVSYTVLGEGRMPSRLAVNADGGTTISMVPQPRRLDRFGNPVPGPNAGRDLRALRLSFLTGVTELEPRAQPVDARSVREQADTLRNSVAPLLAEPAYRALLDVAEARALARLGDVAAGAELLDATARDIPYDDVVFRLAQLEALDGRLGLAIDRARALLASRATDRAAYDGAQLMLRLAIEARQPALFRSALPRIGQTKGTGSEISTALTATLEARAHLWWDSVEEADAQVRSWSYAPEGAALACLARWRLGRSEAGDVEAMRRFVERNPDAAWEGRVALAAAQLGTGRAEDALATLGTAIAGLEPISRDDFMNRQVLDLAHGLYVRALADAGHRRRALAEAHRVRPSLRAGLLPAILVDEVVRAAGGAGR